MRSALACGAEAATRGDARRIYSPSRLALTSSHRLSAAVPGGIAPRELGNADHTRPDCVVDPVDRSGACSAKRCTAFANDVSSTAWIEAPVMAWADTGISNVFDAIALGSPAPDRGASLR
jgi:hypothetical protein